MLSVRKGHIARENASLQTGQLVESDKDTTTGVRNTNAARKTSPMKLAPSLAKELELWPSGPFRPSTKS